MAAFTVINLEWQKLSSTLRIHHEFDFFLFAIPESVIYCSICFLVWDELSLYFLDIVIYLSWFKFSQEEWYRVAAWLISILLKVLLKSWIRSCVLIYILKLSWNFTAKLPLRWYGESTSMYQWSQLAIQRVVIWYNNSGAVSYLAPANHQFYECQAIRSGRKHLWKIVMDQGFNFGKVRSKISNHNLLAILGVTLYCHLQQKTYFVLSDPTPLPSKMSNIFNSVMYGALWSSCSIIVWVYRLWTL